MAGKRQEASDVAGAVLVVAAHPDDELLGVGGTAAALADQGRPVTLAVLCEGVSQRYEAERHAVVTEQARRAAGILGVDDIVIGDLPDQGLDQLSLTEVVSAVEALIDDVAPTTVLTHFGGDVNRDHQLVAEAVLVATRPYAAPDVTEVLMFETPSATEWGSPTRHPVFTPTAFHDISTTIDRKVEAFAQYEAEVRPYPHPRSAQALRERAAYWGSVVNRAAAEPFVVVRSLR